jgi:hypothetical protein
MRPPPPPGTTNFLLKILILDSGYRIWITDPDPRFHDLKFKNNLQMQIGIFFINKKL